VSEQRVLDGSARARSSTAVAGRAAGRSSPGSAASRVLALQRAAGNAAVRTVFARQATLEKPALAPLTPASISAELAGVRVERSEVDVTILRPWEIYELVTANTPRKKALFKELKAVWNAVEAAQARVARADKALAAATAAPPAPVPAGKKKKGKKPPDPAAVKAAAAAALEKAEQRAAAATTAIKAFILEANDLVRALGGEERSLSRRKRVLTAAIAALRRRKKPDAAKLKAAQDELDTVTTRLAELPKAREAARTEVREHSDAISFAPVKTRRNVYTVSVDGATVRLSDRVEAWPTKFASGLVEHGAPGTPLHDVVDKAPISASKRKILRAISANESGSAPFSSVNTYDRAVLTWGLVQWTGGRQSDLTAALTTIKKVAPAAFAARFERYGIDVSANNLVITRGDGTRVTGEAAAQEVQGSVVLSAVFSRAGSDPDIQAAEVAAAAEQQISVPLRATFEVQRPKDPAAKDKTEKVRLRFKDVLTSELAVGLFADRVVNAGGPGTKDDVAAKVRAYVKTKKVDPKDVASWAADAETQIIKTLAPYAERRRPFENEHCSATAGTYLD
jgi:hypothetical protein